MSKKAVSTHEMNQFDFTNQISFDLTRKAGNFSLADIIGALEKSVIDYNIYEVRNYLIYASNIVALPGKKEFRFFNRKALFDNAEFLVKPSKFEVKNSVFFIGDRLMPFMSAGKTFLIKLYVKGTEKKIPRKHIKIPFHELNTYYSLYDSYDGAIQNMQISDRNLPDLDFPPTATAECYDLSSFMSKNGFAFGDYIKFRVVNYGFPCECEIEYCPASAVSSNPAKALKWKDKFETGLKKAITCQKQRGGVFENDALIAAAFYYADKSLLKNPVGSWFDSLLNNDKFALQCFGGKLFVWEKGGIRSYMRNELDRDETTNQDFTDLKHMGIAELTSVMGFKMYEYTIIGYMLDAIHSGGTIGDVKKCCVDDRFKKCAPALKKHLNKLFSGLWKKAKGMANSKICKPEVMKCLHKLLKLRDREVTFIRVLDELDINPENLYSEKLTMLEELLSELEGHICDIIVFRSPQCLKNAKNVIEPVTSKLDSIIKELEEKYLN